MNEREKMGYLHRNLVKKQTPDREKKPEKNTEEMNAERAGTGKKNSGKDLP